MAEIIHLPKGQNAPREPQTVAIYVYQKLSNQRIAQSRDGQLKVHLLKMDADSVIEKYASTDATTKIYVIGYHEAKDLHGKKRDQLQAYFSGDKTR